MYACPLCQQPLMQESKQWVCENRHSFDIAKEGYVNLLPVQNKRSINPGDNLEMMQARRAFLDQGFYHPLIDILSSLLQSHLPNNAKLLDLGCGEGYYTQALAQQLNTTGQRRFWGVDISKTAIRYAAKREPSISFSVASAYQLPFFEDSFDALIRIYAPSEASELRRVIKPHGLLLTVQPAANHLFELKQAIYQTPRLHLEALPALEGFQLLSQQTLHYPMHFNRPDDMLNLINMTPFGWKLDNQKKQYISQTIDLAQANFLIQLQQKLPQ
jgi:23S rRNA (guanine745-N1)-methyltransferase